MALPEHGTLAVRDGVTYEVASTAADAVTLRVPGDPGPLPDELEGGIRRDGDRWGRVVGDTAEIHGSSPAVADRLGLEGDQYNGFRATVPVEELSVVDVREKEIDV
jgi:hypothetical protein